MIQIFVGDGAGGGGECNDNGVGGNYSPSGNDGTVNAMMACESVYGDGNCANDGCGSCNQRGYHKAGESNCNGSTYWNYMSTDLAMDCGWSDCNEVIVSHDGGMNWSPSCDAGTFLIRPEADGSGNCDGGGTDGAPYVHTLSILYPTMFL